MLKLFGPVGAAALALGASLAASAPAEAALGPDAARCRSGSAEPALLVNVHGLKNRRGEVRVKVFGSNPNEFMVRGKGVRRIDVPVTGAGTMQICIALPRAGTYAIVVRHDADANGKTSWNDGAGYSNNPGMSLMSLKPAYRKVAVSVGNGIRPVDVVLNYRRGLSIAPIRS
jgi:uncharacterized protein (DUF2141 family)